MNNIFFVDVDFIGYFWPPGCLLYALHVQICIQTKSLLTFPNKAENVACLSSAFLQCDDFFR